MYIFYTTEETEKKNSLVLEQTCFAIFCTLKKKLLSRYHISKQLIKKFTVLANAVS